MGPSATAHCKVNASDNMGGLVCLTSQPDDEMPAPYPNSSINQLSNNLFLFVS